MRHHRCAHAPARVSCHTASHIRQRGIGERRSDVRDARIFQLRRSNLVVAVILCPAEEDIRRGLHDALAGYDALALIRVDAWRGVRRKDRLLCLFQLQQQSCVVTCGEQPDGAKCADAADADNLEGDIGSSIAIEQGCRALPVGSACTPRRRCAPQARVLSCCPVSGLRQWRLGFDAPAGFAAAFQQFAESRSCGALGPRWRTRLISRCAQLLSSGM